MTPQRFADKLTRKLRLAAKGKLPVELNSAEANLVLVVLEQWAGYHRTHMTQRKAAK